MIRLLMTAILLALMARPLPAQEFIGFGGMMHGIETNENSYSWQLEYLEGVVEHLAYSLSYLNEGHLRQHHRDGHMLQLWGRTNLLDRRLSLAAGIGPFHYFDTTAAAAGASYANDHGWGLNTSFAATLYSDSRLLLKLRTNLITASGSFDTISALIGIGYQLDAPPAPGPLTTLPPRKERPTTNELTLFTGQTIVNSFGSEHALAASVEYRLGVTKHVDASFAWLYEGDNRLVRRHGLITELWGVRRFFADRLDLGIGGGAYFAVSHYPDLIGGKGTSRFVSAIVTLTGSYLFHPSWVVRTSWHRIITNYNRDTDLILAGIGYRF